LLPFYRSSCVNTNKANNNLTTIAKLGDLHIFQRDTLNYTKKFRGIYTVG
jgi:hypothetical protein